MPTHLSQDRSGHIPGAIMGAVEASQRPPLHVHATKPIAAEARLVSGVETHTDLLPEPSEAA